MTVTDGIFSRRENKMKRERMLPIGIENFEEIRRENFYYVDKTKFIEQLLQNWGKVNLFSRPRRFGKSLNMSMLKYFFEVGTDSSLFDGLYISENTKICEQYLGKYPVIFLSLKGVEGLSFTEAKAELAELIMREYRRDSFLLESEKLDEADKDVYRSFGQLRNAVSVMEYSLLVQSLRSLSCLLSKHYGKNTIILIDEYDVPLDKAFQNGYYKEMVSLMRGFLGNALKTNDYLQFAVLTGCLRISKESIFTGLNNFKVLSIIDARFDEQFGFTDNEVKELLSFYSLDDHYLEIKEWYDGYRFGNSEVYCPWDVMNYVDALVSNPNAEPMAYWINTSGNSLVKRFINKADKSTRDEIERLVSGKSIEKKLRLELTYDEIDINIDNLWSVLFTTGYLTQTGKNEDGAYELVIPNKEVHEVFKQQIQEWFEQSVLYSEKTGLNALWNGLENGNAVTVENKLNEILAQTISVLDPKGNEKEKEKYYHAFLNGLLVGKGTWGVLSNKEAGEGFADIIVETEKFDSGFVIELKCADTFAKLDKASEAAIKQIIEKKYADYLYLEGRLQVMIYGISFFKKRCKVIARQLNV